MDPQTKPSVLAVATRREVAGEWKQRSYEESAAGLPVVAVIVVVVASAGPPASVKVCRVVWEMLE